jgi:hypothetical protein
MTMRGLFAASLVALSIGLAGCGERPKVLPQGSEEQQVSDVRERTLQVLSTLAGGDGQALIERELVFLPSRWRRHAQQLQELEALGRMLKGRDDFELGEVRVRGRWALVDSVRAGGERVGPAEVPWFMVYFAGQWRWLPSSILKDPAVQGMMDRSFDQLWAEWQASHPLPARAPNG